MKSTGATLDRPSNVKGSNELQIVRLQLSWLEFEYYSRASTASPSYLMRLEKVIADSIAYTGKTLR